MKEFGAIVWLLIQLVLFIVFAPVVMLVGWDSVPNVRVQD